MAATLDRAGADREKIVAEASLAAYNSGLNRILYMMKAHVMPQLYWYGLVKGWWEGPAIFRKLFR